MSTSGGGRAGGEGKRVFVHIGAPKTGTTYLQHVLFGNAEALAKDGILYPYRDFAQSFRSAMDVCGIGWAGRSRADFAGEWDEVAERVRGWTGHTVIVSNELLAGASRRRADRGIGLLGDAEIHIVFSARDLSRQVVSDWQEQVKHGQTMPLERFAEEISSGRDSALGTGFWRLHDVVEVLRRWTGTVPADRVHIVTVSQGDSPDESLWERFCAVTGMDAGRYDTRARRSNTSMGLHETELVRRLNARLRHPDPQSYDALVRLYLAQDVLGGGTARLSLPPQHRDWARDRSERLVAELTALGYGVVGDVDDLLPVEPPSAYVSPTTLGEPELGSTAIAAAAALLDRAVTLHARNRRLRERRDEPGPGSARAVGGAPDSRRGRLTSLAKRLLRRRA